MKKTVEFLASYGLACVLLGFLFLLTLLGTLEQADRGLFEVQKKYFESLFLIHWLRDTVPLPLPGVYLVLILLTVNLTLGGIVRIRKGSRTYGVIVVHLGMILMFAAGFVKMHFSNEGYLRLFERQQSDEYVSFYEWEVAVFDAAQTRDVNEWLIPEGDFTGLTGERTRSFTADDLPFKLVLSRFAKNGRVMQKGPMWQAENPVVDGYSLKVFPLEKEGEQNVAGLYVRAEDKASGALLKEGILSGIQQFPLVVHAGGKAWGIDLRHKRYKMPFAIVLDKFVRELHPRTPMAKAFMSEVTKIEGGVPQRVKIQMNEPLRHEGLVLFQSSWGPEGAGPGEPLFSQFSVVHNPSDQWPLISCIVTAVGMLIAFGQKLLSYVRAQKAGRVS